VPAPLLDGMTTETSAMRPNFTSLWNLIGLPALSAPMGFVEGLPVGLQIVGKAWDEATVFRVADAYQQLTSWHRQVPELASVVAA
jgi:aspartyl-tRNA(Asn)/glutamyl-tRNA(Gln) amidotransferase subunit A